VCVALLCLSPCSARPKRVCPVGAGRRGKARACAGADLVTQGEQGVVVEELLAGDALLVAAGGSPPGAVLKCVIQSVMRMVD
jgi:hypothetical protein